MKTPARPSPVLRQYVATWTLIHQPSEKKEWSLEEKFRRVKEAGFDGIGSRPRGGIGNLAREHGLDFIAFLYPNASNYREQVEAAQAENPVRANVQFCAHDTPPREAVRAWLKMEALAKKLGFPVDLETHRATCTETPEKLAEMAGLYQRATGHSLPLTWDFSHLAVMKHLKPPFAERLLTHPRLVQDARHFHFRPFNGHHAQLPVTDGRGKETSQFEDYMTFLDAVFTCWFKGAEGGETVYACPEFGPTFGGYGLKAFPDVWKETQLLCGKIDLLWQKHVRRWRHR